MKRFKTVLTEAGNKNTHLVHLEDLVLDGGVKGAREAILALRSLRDMLAGHATRAVDITVKWDGSPAVFAGEDPTDGEFFVAKKSIFNKNPKIYKSHADIDADTSGDLAKKLKMAYDYIKPLGVKGVIQGDFMFDNSDLKSATFDGVKNVVFHPNTIAYAAPIGSKLAKDILAAKIGIVWHTTYSGSSFESMSAEFGKDIVSKLKTSKNVWQVDATLPDVSGSATMTEKETALVTASLSAAGKTFGKISNNVLKEIESNSDLNGLINIFNNTKVRAGQRITNPKKHTKELIDWVNARYEKDKAKRSSVKGKLAIDKKKEAVLSFFTKSNTKQLTMVFELQNHVVDAKLLIIQKLNSLNDIGTFVNTKNGYKVTNPEGFVAIDRDSGGAVKLVDRLEFSTNNFSKDIIKGWENPN